MNILLSCAGRRNYIIDYFLAALSPLGGKVFASNNQAGAVALLVADEGFVVPGLYDPAYLDAVIRICHQHEIRAIVPLFDLELPILASARELLAAEGIRAVVSSRSVVEICNDKWQTADFLARCKLQAPRTYVGLDAAFRALAANEITFPLIVKPRWGMGSIGLLEAEDENELKVLHAKALRIIGRSYLATESTKDPDRSVLVQEKLEGQEYGLDVINDLQGKYMATLVKKKLAMRSGETDSAITVDEPRLRQLGEQLALCLGHVGNLDVDLFLNDSGAYVLEMNARIGGGYPFSHLAGADLPQAIVAWLRDEPADPSCFQLAYNVTGFKGIRPLSAVKSPLDYAAAGAGITVWDTHEVLEQ